MILSEFQSLHRRVLDFNDKRQMAKPNTDSYGRSIYLKQETCFFPPIWVIDSNFESKFKDFWYKNYLFLSWLLLDLFVFFVLLSCDSTISEVTKKNSSFCHLISIFCPWKLMQLGHGAWWRTKLYICWFCCTLISSVLGPSLPVRLCTHTGEILLLWKRWKVDQAQPTCNWSLGNLSVS